MRESRSHGSVRGRSAMGVATAIMCSGMLPQVRRGCDSALAYRVVRRTASSFFAMIAGEKGLATNAVAPTSRASCTRTASL